MENAYPQNNNSSLKAKIIRCIEKTNKNYFKSPSA